MLKKIYSLGINYPKIVISVIAAMTVFFALQLDGLRWETDARVYLPKGHEGIIYDEKVDDIFGVKDTLIVTVVNDEETIYNIETLKRIDRLTKAISKLPGVLASSPIDVASITSATVFEGDNTKMGANPVMEGIPQSEADIEKLKQRVMMNKDLLVGNLVSADGTAAMIRARIKEGAQYRYMSYFQVKALLSKETGEEVDWGPWQGGGNWGKKKSDDKKTDNADDEEEWEGNEWVDGTKWKNGKRIDDTDSESVVDKAVEKATTETANEDVDEDVWEGNQWVDGSKWKDGKRIDDNQSVAKVEVQQEPDKSTDVTVPDEEWEGNKWVSGKNWQNGMPIEAEPKQADQDVDWVASEFETGDVAAVKASTSDVKAESAEDNKADASKPIKDTFYISGRPVIEVSSGIFAMQDMELMVPLLVLVMAIILLIIFRTWRGMILPIMVMSIAIIWTFGLMVVTDVPLYTISTMLPVILVAVGIGDGVHLISSYYDKVLENPQRDPKEIVRESTLQLGAPLVMTSVTTAIGFLALMFAEMPPFKVFGVFALIGILFSWVISATLLPAVLSLLKPKVGNYLQKRRAMRVYSEKNRLAYLLTASARWIESHQQVSVSVLALLVAVTVYGSSKLYVDSSWMSDFREDTEISRATKLINERFSGTIFLNVVMEANKEDAFKDPVLLNKMEGLQSYVETLPYVGDSLSVVDYLKSMNKALHAGDEAYNKIPETHDQIAEYLFLFSVSGRPQQLDQVVDFDYKTGLVTIMIQTDHTRDLKHIMDSVNHYVDENFQGLGVDVNLSGSGNNSYIWADLLIDSQTSAIVLSKVAILLVAALVFGSILAGIYVVIPVTLSTLFVAGTAGLFGIPLDVSTALAAGIAIGVGVDYAIHFIYKYIREKEKTGDHIQAINNTMRTTGYTIVINAIVVSVGFAVLFFSQFPPHVKLGYFVTAYMVVSCLVAIWVLPLLLSYFRPDFASRVSKSEKA